MAKRLLTSAVASSGNTGADYQQIHSYFIGGDTVACSGVVDKAGGHLQVVESSPAGMSVSITKGAAIIRDNNAQPFLKNLYHGVVELDTDIVDIPVTSNSSGSDRVDAAVVYPDLSLAASARGVDQFIGAVVVGSGVSALSDAALQTAVDALVSGYTDVPFLRLANITVADSAASILQADITDTRTQVLRVDRNGGWIPVEVAATRTGNHTFTIPFDATGLVGKGTRIKYKESGGGYEYGVVISASYSAPDTTITLFTNIDYTMATSPIELYYSNANPVDYPDAFSYTPSYPGGFISLGNGTSSARCTVGDGRCSGYVEIILGSTSTVANGAGIDKPITPVTDSESSPCGLVQYRDDSTSTIYLGVLWNSAGDSRLRFFYNKADTTYATTGNITNAIPFTFTTGDKIVATYSYEI